jgi:hypothetical protein
MYNADISSKTGAYYLRREQDLKSGGSERADYASTRGSPSLVVPVTDSSPLATYDAALGGRTSAPPLLPSALSPHFSAPHAGVQALAFIPGDGHHGWKMGGGGAGSAALEYTSVQRSNKALLDTLTKARQVLTCIRFHDVSRHDVWRP